MNHFIQKLQFRPHKFTHTPLRIFVKNNFQFFTVLCIRECLAAVLFWTNLFHKEAFWGILNHSYESWTSTSPSNIHTLHSRLDLYIVVVRNFINTNLHFYSLHQRVFHSRFLLIYGAIVIEAPTAGTKGKGQIICQRWLLHSWILSFKRFRSSLTLLAK